METAVQDSEILNSDISFAAAMARLTTRQLHKAVRQRVTLRDRLADAVLRATQPVDHSTLVERFGPSVSKPLRDLESEGLIKARIVGGMGLGSGKQYLPSGAGWPDHVEPREGPGPKKLTATQRSAAEASKKAVTELSAENIRPWPFYSAKFLPYVRFMDKKMQRRYRRAAEYYGDKVPA